MAPLTTVVGVDGSSVSLDAVRWAARDAELHRSVLTIVSSAPVPAPLTGVGILPEGAVNELRAETRRILAEARAVATHEMLAATATFTETVMSDLPAASTLLELSTRSRMVVIGTRGIGGTGRRSLGSISFALSTHAQCPVTVVREWPDSSRAQAANPVIVGIDGTAASESAVELAFEEADTRSASLTAVHAWSDADSSVGIPVHGLDWPRNRPAAEDALTTIVDRYSQRYPSLQVRRVVVKDRPVHALLDHAQGAQLLVVGSHGRGGFGGMMLGSTSRSVLARAHCPVTVVPSTGRRLARIADAAIANLV